MYCRNCGNEINKEAYVCVKCGVQNGKGDKFCPNCGTQVQEGSDVCLNCGVRLNHSADSEKGSAGGGQNKPKSKITAGILGILVGGLGIHNFYLGYVGKGVAQILLSFCCGVGQIWGMIEGILILTGNIDKDAEGNPLVD